jgi:hypothetical protein
VKYEGMDAKKVVVRIPRLGDWALMLPRHS